MPGRSGLDILEDLKRSRPRIPVLLLTMHPEQQFARRALKAGAAGYLTKDSVPDELKEAIKRIVAGGGPLGSTLAEKPGGGVGPGAPLPFSQPSFPPPTPRLRKTARRNTPQQESHPHSPTPQ